VTHRGEDEGFAEVDAGLAEAHGYQAMWLDVGGRLNVEGRPVDVVRLREMEATAARVMSRPSIWHFVEAESGEAVSRGTTLPGSFVDQDGTARLGVIGSQHLDAIERILNDADPLVRLEAKLDALMHALMHALKAGAIGDWRGC
jgi:hypothetical protein